MSLSELQISTLLEQGFISLPQYKISEKNKSLFLSSVEKDKLSGYQSDYSEHKKYLSDNKIDTNLSIQLKEIAKRYFKLECKLDDTYKITRVIDSSQKSEQFRFHFDSHLFTLVTPINIPKTSSSDKGELILAPQLRLEPISEIKNSLTKIYYKRFSNYDGFQKLKKNKKIVYFDFQNNEPLLFLGRSCYHANNQFISTNNDKRVTVLTHFFDPSPNFSLGRVMRVLRRR